MHIELSYMLASVLVVSAISFVGIVLIPLSEKRIKKLLLYLVSFSAGALIGDVFIHLLPEATRDGFSFEISVYILLGIILSFVVEKLMHWRHYHYLRDGGKKSKIKIMAYMNLFGDGIHNFIDGLAIGVSYAAGLTTGIATTLAVIFHEIPQEFGDFGVLLHSGLKKSKALLYNFLSALTAVAGALISFFMIGASESFFPPLLSFAAGTFIYIAGSNLIPEIQKEKESTQSLLQFVSFMLGIIVMIGLLYVG